MAEEIYNLPDLPYDYGALEPHICGQIMELHHDKHHAAYVKGANATLEKLAKPASEQTSPRSRCSRRTSPSTSPATCCTRCSGRTSPKGGDEPTASSARQLDRDFGSFAAFQRQHDRGGGDDPGLRLGARRLGADRRPPRRPAGLRPPGQPGQGTSPLLVIDAWEHAYYLQYKNVKADFFDAVWNV